jgi:hypothetical protein
LLGLDARDCCLAFLDLIFSEYSGENHRAFCRCNGAAEFSVLLAAHVSDSSSLRQAFTMYLVLLVIKGCPFWMV